MSDIGKDSKTSKRKVLSASQDRAIMAENQPASLSPSLLSPQQEHSQCTNDHETQTTVTRGHPGPEIHGYQTLLQEFCMNSVGGIG